jgi:uncharacterized heparinase superfamily protein
MAASPTSRLARVRAGAGLWAEAAAGAVRRQVRTEWFGSPFHLWRLERPLADRFAAAPRDLRPVDIQQGQAILDGRFLLAGESLVMQRGGDPWNQPSPSRGFAAMLHQFGWLGALMDTGDAGVAEALRLTLEWRKIFDRWNSFAWSGQVLERRVFNLACAARRLAAGASQPAELAQSLARQARHLLALADRPDRRAERLATAAIAGCALAGEAGDRLMTEGCAGLDAALGQAVLADGGHASRSPEAGMELLFDLMSLDDGLSQRGRPAPEGLSHAIDRLTAALRFFTLPDGRLASFQGGQESGAARVAAARAHDAGPSDGAETQREAPYSGYQSMTGKAVTVMADVGPPARGAWSRGACGQPLALEVVCGRDRLITGCGWSESAWGFPVQETEAARLAAGGSTVSIGDGTVGAPLRGFAAFGLGPRLVGGVAAVSVNRRESDTGVWLEMAHGGWLAQTGLTHERRLFLDKQSDELRGEDRFVPAEQAGAHFEPVAIYFHLHPDVRAQLARDQRSVLLSGPSGAGWWLRNDAGEVSVEPSIHFARGRPRWASQVVLRGRLRADRGGRVRWKLAAADQAAP